MIRSQLQFFNDGYGMRYLLGVLSVDARALNRWVSMPGMLNAWVMPLITNNTLKTMD